MSTVYEIPLTPTPQRFSISLSGTRYRVTVRWNESVACWVFDLADTSDAPILAGVPIVTGADLLGQFAYLSLGGALYATTDYTPDAVPTYDNLGTASHWYWVVP